MLHFPSPTFAYILRRVFLPFQQLAILNSRDILILQFSWDLIHEAFFFKSRIKIVTTFTTFSSFESSLNIILLL